MQYTPELTKLRHSLTDTTAMYAVVGATDLAVEIVRDARGRAMAVRDQMDVSTLPDKAVAGVGTLAGRAQQMPAAAFESTRALSSKVEDGYGQLADRGHRLVSRVRGQQATKDLLAQADSTVARGRGAVTSVRRAATDTRRSARGTITTARHDASTAADELAAEISTAKTRARKTTASTTSAARRTATTTRKRTATARSATKGAATSVRKTAAAAERAAGAAAEKIGD